MLNTTAAMENRFTLSALFRTAALVATASICVMASAQWSTNPAEPLVVATPAGAPDGLRAFSDGNGGWYTFWRDKRGDGTHFDVYGQRFDADGFALWAANGALVYHEEGRTVSNYTITRLPTGNLMLAVVTGVPPAFTDPMRAVLLAPGASPIWPAPVVITQQGMPVLALGSLQAIPSGDGAIIGWYDTYFGGGAGVNVTRITSTGTILWEPNGYAIPGASYGPFALNPDGADGTIALWRLGNGLGQGYQAMRVNNAGANAWPANLAVTPPGNGFMGNHVLQPGPDATTFMTYVGAASKAQLLQFDTSGVLSLDPSPVTVCPYASVQNTVNMVHESGITTVVWGDNRPPASNQDVYMQRFDAEGNQLLDPDGVLVMHLNTYIPTTGVVASLNGSIIATIDGNLDGYSAMRMNADGTPAWPSPAAFCTPAHNPFYERQVQLPDGEGGIVSFWTTIGATVHGARIYADGSLGDHTGMDESMAHRPLSLYPSPASSLLTIELPDAGPLSSIRAMDARGRRVALNATRQSDRLLADVSALPGGLYVLELVLGTSLRTARFMVGH